MKDERNKLAASWLPFIIHHSSFIVSKFRRLESNQHPPVFSGTLDLRAAPEKLGTMYPGIQKNRPCPGEMVHDIG